MQNNIVQVDEIHTIEFQVRLQRYLKELTKGYNHYPRGLKSGVKERRIFDNIRRNWYIEDRTDEASGNIKKRTVMRLDTLLPVIGYFKKTIDDFYQWQEANYNKEFSANEDYNNNDNSSNLKPRNTFHSIDQRRLIIAAICLSLFSLLAFAYYPKSDNAYIKAFYAITPEDPTHCMNESFYKKPPKKLDDQHVLYSGDCFAAELILNSHHELYIFSESNNELSLLYPTTVCNPIGFINGISKDVNKIVFPVDDSGYKTMFLLDEKQAFESLIVLATEKNRISNAQRDLIAQIPEKCLIDAKNNTNTVVDIETLSKSNKKPWEKNVELAKFTIEHHSLNN